ncbi:MAG: glycosyltransferase family 4 protein [Anaerolineales bacterium]
MKILCVNKFFHVRGGADRYFFETIAALEARGHEVVHFSSAHPRNRPSPYAAYFSPLGGAEDDLPDMSLTRRARMFANGVYSFAAARLLARLVADTRPDVAHVHNILYQLSPSVVGALRRLRVPVVQSLHDWHIVCGGAYLYTHDGICERCRGGRFYNCARYKCYRESRAASAMATANKYVDSVLNLWQGGVQAYTVPSEHMAARLARWGLPRERLHVIRNPFSLNGLKPTYATNDHVLWYGRLIRLKGIYTLLEAARRRPHVHFELYGDGPEAAAVRAFIADHELDNVLLDTETRWGPELQARIANATCVVDPSEWHHPSQYVWWETAALGTAMIATRMGSSPDVIADGENGLLFDSGEVSQLCAQIDYLYADRDAAKRLGRAARATVETLVAEQPFVERLEWIYDRALQARQNGYRDESAI